MDKKLTTVFIITSIVIAGTALAAVFTTNTTTRTLFFGSKPAISTTTTTTTLGDAKSEPATVSVATARDTDLASVLLRVLGIQVGVEEITTLKSRNMGYGEITLAYNLAHASGKSVHEILAMRYDQKMGWGKIANTLGVKLHDASDRSEKILREVQLSEDADKFKIDIQIDLDDDDKDHGHNNNNGNDNSHKPEKMDNNKPHKNQDKDHGKN